MFFSLGQRLLAALAIPFGLFIQSSLHGESGTTWDRFIEDLRPNLEAGKLGLTVDQGFWKKYDGMNVEWRGILKTCQKLKDGSTSCELKMPAKSIRIKGLEKASVVDALILRLANGEANRWSSLQTGAQVQFSAKTTPIVLPVPPDFPFRLTVPVLLLLENGILLSSPAR